jgi:hypothetical protein
VGAKPHIWPANLPTASIDFARCLDCRQRRPRLLGRVEWFARHLT